MTGKEEHAQPSADASRKTSISPKVALVRQTLVEEYPGLDYLGLNSVLVAKHRWFRILWFTTVFVLLGVSLFAVYRTLKEYTEQPISTHLNVKLVEKMLIPQVTVCPTTAMTFDIPLLANHMKQALHSSTISDEVIVDFAEFMIAGSGFQKMDPFIFGWNETYINYLSSIYYAMRNEMNARTFFYTFFNIYGIQCEQLFQQCKIGPTVTDCCEIFEPTYMIRRGRCFKTARPLYQSNLDELGKFRIQMKAPNIMEASEAPQNEIIIHVGDFKPDIDPYPRYYLYAGQYNRLRLTARYLNLLPGTEHCSGDYANTGKATCYLSKWLVDNLETPYNCTYPYMDKIRNVSLSSCDADVLVKNYRTAVNAEEYYSQQCAVACKRWEYTVFIDRTPDPPAEDSSNKSDYSFRADIYYNDLMFEEITEVYILTFFGLLAQIGGQLSLYLGTSIMSLIQIFLMVVVLSKRGITLVLKPASHSARRIRNSCRAVAKVKENSRVNNCELKNLDVLCHARVPISRPCRCNNIQKIPVITTENDTH